MEKQIIDKSSESKIKTVNLKNLVGDGFLLKKTKKNGLNIVEYLKGDLPFEACFIKETLEEAEELMAVYLEEKGL